MKKLFVVASVLIVFTFDACRNRAVQQTAENQQEKGMAELVETVDRFEYHNPEPKNGKMKGVVELGAAGFNSFIIRLDQEKNWKLEKAEFGSSGVLEGNSTEEDVLKKLKDYIKKIITFGVNGENIHFVVSSGARDEESVKTTIAALKKIGYVVNVVTPEKEGEYALKSAMPKEYKDKAFVVDMGSSNTKISWIAEGKISALETYGAKYYQKDIDVQTAHQAVSKVAKGVPKSNRDVCFMIGGVPFQMAKNDRVEKERYTVLRSEKVYISDDFKDDKSQAGLNIYKAIRESTGCKTFVFDWNANFTIGFLLTIPY